MRLVYGISRWTNASRPGARHLDNGSGLPLCGGGGRKVFSWEKETGEPTCDKCWRMHSSCLPIDEAAIYIERMREVESRKAEQT